jgi:hypothetical protein
VRVKGMYCRHTTVQGTLQRAKDVLWLSVVMLRCMHMPMMSALMVMPGLPLKTMMMRRSGKGPTLAGLRYDLSV